MATSIAQRSRRPPQPHQMTQGLPQSSQSREPSGSPSLLERPRAAKTQSMPVAPTIAQIQQVSQITPQASPTGSNTSRRTPPLPAMQRLHTSPSQTTAAIDNRISPPLPQQSQNNFNTHYDYIHNTVGRSHQPPTIQSRYQLRDDEFQMTPEILADIEHAQILQQRQTQGSGSPYSTYPRNGSTTPPPPKDYNAERVRTVERESPIDYEQRRQRDTIPNRESPIVRDRLANSPVVSVLSQAQTPSEHRMSPARVSPLGASSGETYIPYNTTRDSPPIHRRNTVNTTSDTRSPYTLASQPSTQTTQPRGNDRSLPVQEEPEDDPAVSKHDTVIHDAWKGIEVLDKQHRSSSPAPSSDLHPEGNSKRFDSSHTEVDVRKVSQHFQEDQEEYEPDGVKTPRSPSVGLPDRGTANTAGNRGRVASRNGVLDQMGLHGIDQAMYYPPHNAVHLNGDLRSQYSSLGHNPMHQRYLHESNPRNGYHPQMYEEYIPYADPSHLYHDEYYERVRPDAPIPPTPHSQTAAPSPSPWFGRNTASFASQSPGSPYPYPFNHVRRQPLHNRPSAIDPHDPNLLQQQFARQFKTYAQNRDQNFEVSDSTFSPASTPFQGNYDPWANFIARRMINGQGHLEVPHDLRSMQSSPSHEPLPVAPLPRPGKKTQASRLSNEVTPRNPPPRVESTQPRETSPELSSSGEETAGEQQYSTRRSSWGTNGNVNRTTSDHHVEDEDGNGDWVDEDEELDEDDLLELDYHPSFVNNDSKRRRRWEIGWERLLEAFHDLDRQTDTTMVLLAAPSHTNRLHCVRSRGVRRQAMQTNTPDMTPLRIGFKRIAAHRRKLRTESRTSLVDRFLATSSVSGDGSDTGSESKEEELRRALETAVKGLSAFRHMFDQREARWIEENRRVVEDREWATNLIRQVLGEPLHGGLGL